MALEPLCEPSDVKLLLGESYDLDTAQDEDLHMLIEVASEEIRVETRRQFGSRELAVTRSFVASKADSVYIDELMDPADVTSVNGPLGPLVVDDYRVVPEGYPIRGSYMYMSGTSWPSAEQWPPEHLDWFTRNMRDFFARAHGVELRGAVVQVTGDFGYEVIPSVVRHLCARTVASWWKTEIATGGRGGGQEQLIPTAPVGILPEAIVTSLRRWKHPEVVG